MKNLDLEKLKRENIYQTPEHLFEGVQSRVFSQLSLHKSSVSNAKVIELFGKYAVAAAVVLIFSIGGFVLFKHQGEETLPANREEVLLTYQEDTAIEVQPHTEIEEEKIHYTAVKTIIPETNPPVQNLHTIMHKNIDKNIDELISSYSNVEINQLVNESEPDVYLDIFY